MEKWSPSAECLLFHIVNLTPSTGRENYLKVKDYLYCWNDTRTQNGEYVVKSKVIVVKLPKVSGNTWIELK